MKQQMLLDSLWNVIFHTHQKYWWNFSIGVTYNGMPNAREVGKLVIFDQYLAIFLEMVQVRGMVIVDS